MMKSEFEQMINKEISAKTYAIYEAMYMALPEGISKQAFVQMLNVDAIPEAREAVARKEARALYIKDIKAQINDYKGLIEYYKKRVASLQELKSDAFWLNEIKLYKKHINHYLNEIKQLKSLL